MSNSTSDTGFPPRLGFFLAIAVLVILMPLFWKVRILDTAVQPGPTLWSSDMYTEHHLMTDYGFHELAAGRLPLWNPYGLCGEPFLAAATYVGLFYPINLIYLLFDTDTATEIIYVLHLLFGALSMLWLAKDLGIGWLGGVAAALTFVWSGWMTQNANYPWVFNGMTWIPLTVLAVDRVARGVRLAWLWLVAVVAFQVLLGSMEIFLHALYAAAIFALGRLLHLMWHDAWRAALQRAAVLLACLGAGTFLGAPQLLPTLELLQNSARTPGMLNLEQSLSGAVPPLAFLAGALGDLRAAFVGVGILPLLAIVLVFGERRLRLVWVCALVAVVAAAALVWGDPVYRFYYALPVGKVFRRPFKFLDIYAFGQALLVGVALARLRGWAGLERRQLWRQAPWLGALAAAAVLLFCRRRFVGSIDPWALAVVGVLLVFGGLRSAKPRLALLVLLVAVQGATLFFSFANRALRPSQQPEVFTRYDDVLQFVQQRAGYDRTYGYLTLVGELARQVPWGVMPKLMRNGIYLVVDYEPLAPSRYQGFFDYLSFRPQESPFGGGYFLPGTSRWRMMDLTGTRYYLAYRGGRGDDFLARGGAPGGPRFHLIRDGFVRVYEKEGVLPRAYVVPRARVIRDPEQVLAALDDPRFDPRTEVLLEDEPRELPAEPGPPLPGRAEIVGYAAARVAIAVDAPTPGLLVLSDFIYPGWKAFVNDREVPILRANYLFRAVQIDRDTRLVRFEYHPASFRYGVLLSGGTALVVAALAVVARRRLNTWSGNGV